MMKLNPLSVVFLMLVFLGATLTLISEATWLLALGLVIWASGLIAGVVYYWVSWIRSRRVRQ